VGRTIVATPATTPSANSAAGGTWLGRRSANTIAPVATIAVRTIVARLSVMIVPADRNCSGSSATTTPATSPAVFPTRRHPTSTVNATASRLTTAWIGLIAHSLPVSHRIGTRSAGYPGVRTYMGGESSGDRLKRPDSRSARAGPR
jgi:hypothetical protein